MRGKRAAFGLLMALSIASFASAQVQAQPVDPVVAARDQFRDGVALMTAGDFAGALTKFKLVARVKMNAQVAFNIADCDEHLGNLVSALGNYRLAAQKAQDGTAPQVAAVVDARIDAIGKRIPRLTIERTESVPNPRATIELDGTDLAASQIGKPIAVNPGDRLVTVVSHGQLIATQHVSLAEGETRTLKVIIPPPPPEKDSGDVDMKPVANGPSVPGIVLSSAGGVSLVLGFVFIGVRQAAIGDLNKVCNADHVCPATAKPDADRGKLMTGLAEVTIPVGVVALTTGIVLIATHKKADANRASTLLPIVANANGFSVDAAFGAPLADGPGASLLGRF